MPQAKAGSPKRRKTIAAVAPGAGTNPPDAKPSSPDEVAAVLEQLLLEQAAAPRPTILLTGVPERTVQALAHLSPDGLSPAAALMVAALTPAAAPVVGLPANVAQALAKASPPGILSRESLATLVKLSPNLQVLSGLTPRTALLLAVISPDGVADNTLEVIEKFEPEAGRLRQRAKRD